MICKHCGAEIPDGGSFCTSCGKSLENIDSKKNGTEEKATLIPDNQEENSADNVLNNLDNTEGAAASENGNSPLTAKPSFESEEDSGTSSEESESPYFPPGATVSDTLDTKQEKPVYIAPVMVKPKAKREKAGKGKTALVSILLGILIFAFTFASECLILANITFSKQNISKAAAEINPADTKIGALLETESVKAALEEEGVKTENFNADTTLGDFLAALSIDFPMSGDDVMALFEETDIMEEFSAIAADYEQYLLTGEGGDYLNSKKVLSIIESRRAEILQYTGVDISEYSDKIEETVDELKSEIKDINPENSLGGFGRIAYIFLSPAAIVVISAFALFFTILIMTVTKRFFAGILTLGISSALSGLICFIAALFHSLFLSATMPGGTEMDKLFSKLFKESLFDDMLKISLIFLGIGALLIAVKVIQNAAVKKINNG